MKLWQMLNELIRRAYLEFPTSREISGSPTFLESIWCFWAYVKIVLNLVTYYSYEKF